MLDGVIGRDDAHISWREPPPTGEGPGIVRWTRKCAEEAKPLCFVGDSGFQESSRILRRSRMWQFLLDNIPACNTCNSKWKFHFGLLTDHRIKMSGGQHWCRIWHVVLEPQEGRLCSFKFHRNRLPWCDNEEMSFHQNQATASGGYTFWRYIWQISVCWLIGDNANPCWWQAKRTDCIACAPSLLLFGSLQVGLQTLTRNAFRSSSLVSLNILLRGRCHGRPCCATDPDFHPISQQHAAPPPRWHEVITWQLRLNHVTARRWRWLTGTLVFATICFGRR